MDRERTRHGAAGPRLFAAALALLMLAVAALVPASASAAQPAAMHGHHHERPVVSDTAPTSYGAHVRALRAGPAGGCGDGAPHGHDGGCCMAGACAAMCGGIAPSAAGLPVPPGMGTVGAMTQPPRRGKAVAPDLPPPRVRA